MMAVQSFHEDGVTPINPAWLQAQAIEWAETLAASSRPFVSLDTIYAWGGKLALGNDSWDAEPLDIPRDLANEMFRWLAARAGEQTRGRGAQ